MVNARPVLCTRTCPKCGDDFPVTSRGRSKTYCSRACLNSPPLKADPTHEEMVGGYRLIPLSQGQFAKVDSSCYESMMRWKWTAWWSPNSESFYAVRNEPIEGTKRVRRVIMAREIMNAPSGVTVDHKDHDTLNNRGFNLRIATYSQNSCNTRKRKNAMSKYKGVSWHGQSKKWRATVQFNGVVKRIGLFDTEEMAFAACQSERTNMHGEFAYGSIAGE